MMIKINKIKLKLKYINIYEISQLIPFCLELMIQLGHLFIKMVIIIQFCHHQLINLI
jgi:hypothetical protein